MRRAQIEIRRTDDIEAALALGARAGLVEMENDVGGLTALWGAYEGQTLMGIVALCRRDGLDIVGWLAGCLRGSSRPWCRHASVV